MGADISQKQICQAPVFQQTKIEISLKPDNDEQSLASSTKLGGNGSCIWKEMSPNCYTHQIVYCIGNSLQP